MLRAALSTFALVFAQSLLADLALKQTDDAITLSAHGQTVVVYHVAPNQPPSELNVSEAYRRSGYIHPLYTPSGGAITGDYPADHPHHHGIWSAWTSATFDGRQTDFWNTLKAQGFVEHRRILNTRESPGRVGFTAALAQVETQTGTPLDAIHETWTVALSLASDGSYLLDVSSCQRLASDKPFTVNKHLYGGFGFRATSQWMEPAASAVLNSDGLDRADADQKPTRWVHIAGAIDGRSESITVLCHPTTFRAPQPARIHPKIPYFSWAPGNQEAFDFEPGRDYVFNYRYIVWKTTPSQADIEQAFQEYATLPQP